MDHFRLQFLTVLVPLEPFTNRIALRHCVFHDTLYVTTSVDIIRPIPFHQIFFQKSAIQIGYDPDLTSHLFVTDQTANPPSIPVIHYLFSSTMPLSPPEYNHKRPRSSPSTAPKSRRCCHPDCSCSPGTCACPRISVKTSTSCCPGLSETVATAVQGIALSDLPSCCSSQPVQITNPPLAPTSCCGNPITKPNPPLIHPSSTFNDVPPHQIQSNVVYQRSSGCVSRTPHTSAMQVLQSVLNNPIQQLVVSTPIVQVSTPDISHEQLLLPSTANDPDPCHVFSHQLPTLHTSTSSPGIVQLEPNSYQQNVQPASSQLETLSSSLPEFLFAPLRAVDWVPTRPMAGTSVLGMDGQEVDDGSQRNGFADPRLGGVAGLEDLLRNRPENTCCVQQTSVDDKTEPNERNEVHEGLIFENDLQFRKDNQSGGLQGLNEHDGGVVGPGFGQNEQVGGEFDQRVQISGGAFEDVVQTGMSFSKGVQTGNGMAQEMGVNGGVVEGVQVTEGFDGGLWAGLGYSGDAGWGIGESADGGNGLIGDESRVNGEGIVGTGDVREIRVEEAKSSEMGKLNREKVGNTVEKVRRDEETAKGKQLERVKTDKVEEGKRVGGKCDEVLMNGKVKKDVVKVEGKVEEVGSSSATSRGRGGGRRRRSSTFPGSEARDRKFACDLCSSTFFFKQNRDRHVNEVHLGRRPHKCEYPGCEGAFKNRSGLKQHVRTVHEKARPFKCNQCDSAFGQRNHLTQHVLVVHEKVKQYACEYCDMLFSNVGNRTQHVRRRHKDMVKQGGK